MEKSAASVPTKHILAAGYIIHLILIAVFTTCILAKHSDLIAASATGIMLFLYGYMGVWLLLISFLLIVRLILRRSSKNMKQQWYLIE